MSQVAGATRAELLAADLSPEEICKSIGADSLGYVSLDGLVEATRIDRDRLCRACFDGTYPLEPADHAIAVRHAGAAL